MKKTQYHPLLYTYLKKYQEDPTSRVFAPLAEAYRKAGLVNEAIEIAREGLRTHPHFVGGRVALARALFDHRHYKEVTEELASVIRDVPDNLVAQKLFAESCLILGRFVEALDSYKMLLYFVPQDLEIAQLVHELEAQAYEKGMLVLKADTQQSKSLPSFSIRSAQSAIEEAPEKRHSRWVKQVEILQSLLLRVERYKTLIKIHLNSPLQQ